MRPLVPLCECPFSTEAGGLFSLPIFLVGCCSVCVSVDLSQCHLQTTSASGHRGQLRLQKKDADCDLFVGSVESHLTVMRQRMEGEKLSSITGAVFLTGGRGCLNRMSERDILSSSE